MNFDGMKLGLAPKRVDPRTIQYREMLADAPWDAPPAYSFDEENPGCPVPLFANDRYGDCVIVARAHQTMRFELLEQGTVLPITDREVVEEYLSESGGQDNGLVMLYAMRAWRKGWLAGGGAYNIHAFLEVQPQRHEMVKEAMLVGAGLQFGIDLPLSALDQLNASAEWDVVAGPRGERRSWGGHAMWSGTYDRDGVVFGTWGKRQRATWRWIDAYASECYLVIDDVNRAKTLDPAILNAALADLHP